MRNAARAGSAKRSLLSPQVLEKVRRWASAPVMSRDDAEAGERASPGTLEFSEIYSLLVADPRSYSAELNAMYPYLERGEVAATTLLAADSGTSELCAKLIAQYLEDRGVRSQVYRVEELGRSFDEGLYNLLDRAALVASRYREDGYVVYLNATGGFKLETAVLYVAAGLLGLDRVYYIHETMKEVVEIPTIPLTVKPEYRDLLEVFRGRDKVLRREVEHRVGRKILEELEKRGIIAVLGREVAIRRWLKILLK